MNRSLLALFAMLACLVVLSLWLAGCSTDVGVKEGVQVSKSTITWIDRDPESCGAVVPSKTLMLHGCANVQYTADGAICTVTMRRDSQNWIVNHEFLHCFGFMHTD